MSAVAFLASCSPSAPNLTAPPMPDTASAFGGVQCSAVRPQTEPDLTGWDSGSRLNLRRLSRQGVVAVRYETHGCDVRLEVLSHCIGKGEYTYQPYAAQDTKIARSIQDLFAQVPLGAANLQGRLAGGKVLRTDYILVGMDSLPANKAYVRADLEGPDCQRATHIVSTVYVGGFGMAAGEGRTIEASASIFGVGAGAFDRSSAERVTSDGDATACEEAKKAKKEDDNCAVPLRIGLQALDVVAIQCPEGSVLVGNECVTKPPVVSVKCPSGSTWDGTRCAPAGAPVDPGRPAPATPPAPAGRCQGMIEIPAGSYSMGSGESTDESPGHQVTVTALCMDAKEVTVAEYEVCVQAHTCSAAFRIASWPGIKHDEQHNWSQFCNAGRTDRQNHPMNCVDWNQANTYCGWAGKRLPTEEEWEYGARGTDGRRYPWGNSAPVSTLLNGCGQECASMTSRVPAWAGTMPMYAGSDGWEGTAPVGSYPAGRSPFGLFDMAGNVDEWTSSHYCPNYGVRNCGGPNRTTRGGSWFPSSPNAVTTTTRISGLPSESAPTTGFRCVR